MALLPQSNLPIFYRGQAVPNARLRVWLAGSTAPAPIFADPAYTVALPNPVPVDGFGNLPTIYAVGALRLRAEDDKGFAYWSVDRIVLADPPPPAVAEESSARSTQFQTGDLKHRYATGLHTGWVRANGRTIGSAASGASERANADCQALFLFLWGRDPILVISGSRGTSAQADWEADKTIQLPDVRGRALFGLDDMGGGPSARLTGGLFGAGTSIRLGSSGGESRHALVKAELAAHDHALTVAMDEAGAHTHPVTIEQSPTHNHGLSYNLGPVGGGSGSNAVTGIGPGGPSPTGTDQGGAHTHTATTTSAGAHKHTVTATLGMEGTSKPFNLLPPFLLISIYIKL